MVVKLGIKRYIIIILIDNCDRRPIRCMYNKGVKNKKKKDNTVVIKLCFENHSSELYNIIFKNKYNIYQYKQKKNMRFLDYYQ